MEQPKYCYVDDSIHDSLGFIALAFIFSNFDLDEVVQSALRLSGFDPSCEEYKSGVRMDGNSAMQAARSALTKVIREHAQVGIVFAVRNHDVPLGRQCLQALQSILIRNGISPKGLRVHIDQGIFSSCRQAFDIQSKFQFLSSISLFPCEKSHECRGIQIADLVAHSLSQVVREGITGDPKAVYVGGPNSGYESDVMLPLSDFILAGFCYSILRRRLIQEGSEFDPATDPLIFELDEDTTSYGLNPEILGWGVQVSQKAPDAVRYAVSKMLGRIWLGCMH